ncbi:hypothetical protein HDV05_003321 [Chytridiales sp. JEL 0842]|nr:hypothetical protein HDV05_003321 [Chytridiales sp. JEL 0842]
MIMTSTLVSTVKAVALYDSTADHPSELSFKRGDCILDVLPSSAPGWFTGRLKNTSTRGLFPENYVRFLHPTDPDSEELAVEDAAEFPCSTMPYLGVNSIPLKGDSKDSRLHPTIPPAILIPALKTPLTLLVLHNSTFVLPHPPMREGQSIRQPHPHPSRTSRKVKRTRQSIFLFFFTSNPEWPPTDPKTTTTTADDDDDDKLL